MGEVKTKGSVQEGFHLLKETDRSLEAWLLISKGCFSLKTVGSFQKNVILCLPHAMGCRL